MTSAFKVGIAGCAVRFASQGFPGCSTLPGVFPTVFVLYSDDLTSEVLSSKPSTLFL